MKVLLNKPTSRSSRQVKVPELEVGMIVTHCGIRCVFLNRMNLSNKAILFFMNEGTGEFFSVEAWLTNSFYFVESKVETMSVTLVYET